jgi:prepilin-type N-terminal cleavage/methylation domain-containing protein
MIGNFPRANRTPSARPASAFTLFEVILALMILSLLAGAVYAIATAATGAAQATMEEQVSVRRLKRS